MMWSFAAIFDPQRRLSGLFKASAPQTWECNCSEWELCHLQKHISSHSPLLFLFLLRLSNWFDSGKSWGELVGSVQQLLFFLHRGGETRTGLSEGRRQCNPRHCLPILVEWLQQLLPVLQLALLQNSFIIHKTLKSHSERSLISSWSASY